VTKVNIEALALLPIANDLAYICECLALDYTVEAKTELSALIKTVEQTDNTVVRGVMLQHCGSLADSIALLRDTRQHEAAGNISRIGRDVWHQILY
jgi:hypothetical protein